MVVGQPQELPLRPLQVHWICRSSFRAMMRCVRRWQLNAICALDMATRHVCRHVPPAQPYVCNLSSFLGQPRRFYVGVQIKRDKRIALADQPGMRQPATRRIWKTPGSALKWLLLLNALIITGWVYAFYRVAIATQAYPGPSNDPFREFGIVAYALVLLVTAYTLRRRFVRTLPGRVQNWLWLHVWFGMSTVLIACMHENFQNITHDFSFEQSRFTEANFGTTALYALIL